MLALSVLHWHAFGMHGYRASQIWWFSEHMQLIVKLAVAGGGDQ